MNVEIVLPAVDDGFLSGSLRDLTRRICEAHPDLEGGYGLGGPHGYGENFENGVFAMRRFYWGDCDCGHDKREEEWCKSHKHSADCYQTELRRRRIATGMWDERPDSAFEYWKTDAPYKKREAAESKIFDDLCKEYKLDRKFGCAVHCTCDYKKEWKAFCEAPDGRHSATCSLELPNFLHKKSGFEVRWYKYIGRGMETKNQPPDLMDIFHECAKSLK